MKTLLIMRHAKSSWGGNTHSPTGVFRKQIQAKVTRVADDPSYKQNATRIQSIVRATVGAENAADVILDFVSAQR